jgi:hypothetical protein
MNQQPTLPGLCGRAAIVHTITYMFMGIIASAVLDYKTDFARPEMACWMRQFDDPILRAGVLFQPIRGALFGLAFYPLREFVFGKKNGWLTIWWLLLALAILGTFGPAPGSLEGMIFTHIPGQYRGYLEVVPQAFLFSAIVYYWVNKPQKKWLNWTLGVLFVVTMLLPILDLTTRAHHGG